MVGEIFKSKIFILNVRRKQDTTSLSILPSENLKSKLSGIKHQFVFSENENVVEGINEFVKKNKVDIVTIVPHQYNLLERLFHTSISKKLAFHTHVPLLVLSKEK
ncbi:MAG TPA: universal stress protein [Bacteroidia bacterium]|jgi:ornithine carbamoyltransferase|nr:universal stress protein [Bacteroidia bacterium]